MPRSSRDEKKAAREAAGLRFRQWAEPIVKASGLGNTEIANRAQELVRRSGDEEGRAFDKSAVTHWLDGLYVPEVRNTLLFARVLNADPVDALHAAGHDYLIAQLIELVQAQGAEREPGQSLTEKYRAYFERGRELCDDTGHDDNDRTAS